MPLLGRRRGDSGRGWRAAAPSITRGPRLVEGPTTQGDARLMHASFFACGSGAGVVPRNLPGDRLDPALISVNAGWSTTFVRNRGRPPSPTFNKGYTSPEYGKRQQCDAGCWISEYVMHFRHCSRHSIHPAIQFSALRKSALRQGECVREKRADAVTYTHAAMAIGPRSPRGSSLGRALALVPRMWMTGGADHSVGYPKHQATATCDPAFRIDDSWDAVAIMRRQALHPCLRRHFAFGVRSPYPLVGAAKLGGRPFRLAGGQRMDRSPPSVVPADHPVPQEGSFISIARDIL